MRCTEFVRDVIRFAACSPEVVYQVLQVMHMSDYRASNARASQGRGAGGAERAPSPTGLRISGGGP